MEARTDLSKQVAFDKKVYDQRHELKTQSLMAAHKDLQAYVAKLKVSAPPAGASSSSTSAAPAAARSATPAAATTTSYFYDTN